MINEMLANPGSVWIFRTRVNLPTTANVSICVDARFGNLELMSTVTMGEEIIILGEVVIYNGMEFMRVLHDMKPGWMYTRNATLFERVDV